MFRGIRFKLTLINVAVLFVILFFTQTLVYIVMKDQLLRQTDDLLQINADRTLRFSGLLRGTDRGIQFPRSKMIFESPFKDPISFVLSDANGRVVFSSFSGLADVQTGPSLKAHLNEFRIVHINATPYRMYTKAVRGGMFDGYISVYAEMGNIRKILATLRVILMVLLGVGLILTFTGGLLLADRALIPIRNAWKRQQEFVADASHELRTPISIISMNLEIVMKEPTASVEDVREWLSDAQQETVWMTRLVGQLLTLARTDAEVTQLEITAFCLTDLVASACEQMKVLFDDSSVNLSVHAETKIFVEGDVHRIRQMVLILLDNAVKYTPANGHVTCSVELAGDYVLLSVSDTGIGIPLADLERIFERFYRVDKARSRSVGGAGLGLSIAKWIADAHKAKILVTSQLGEGTEICVRLHQHMEPSKERSTSLDGSHG